jgi:hypothetical protein
MTEPAFLEEYGGQSLDELIAMEATHRIDSLVLAIESALDRKAVDRGAAALSPEERVVLAVEALEREVNNGGYDQFFLNSSRAYAGDLERALRAIGCPEQADIARRAVEALKIKGAVTAESVEAAHAAAGDDLSDVLGSLDDEYYSSDEPIADRLFAFVKANRAAIKLR